MSTATLPSVDREPPCVGDWWFCEECGHTERLAMPDKWCQCSADRFRRLRLTESDWLKCTSRDALAMMLSSFFAGDMVAGVPRRELRKWHAESVEAICCNFGNPFRPVTMDPAWLTWNDGTVKRLAEACSDRMCQRCGGDGLAEAPPHPNSAWPCNRCKGIGREKFVSVEELPILADALEEAGCTIDDVLRHLREPGNHWPGCFVLRAILEAS